MSNRVDVLKVMGTDHFNMRDMREQWGLERGLMFRCAASARAVIDKASVHRKYRLQSAIEHRNNAAVLRAALKAVQGPQA